MADMRRTLKVIHFASQLCGISQFGSFLRNGGYEEPVLCRKYLLYSFILNIVISVIRLHILIDIFREVTNVSSEAHRVHMQIMLIFVSCIFTTYLVSTLTRLIGQRNFFKISRKLLSVGSFVNYREGTVFSNAVIAVHVVLFVTYLIPLCFGWISNNCRWYELPVFLSTLVCDTVTSSAALQFLYFVFTLRRHLMLLNSRLNEVGMSTVTSENIFSLKVPNVSELIPESYSVNSGLREFVNLHFLLCDVLQLIDSSYSVQVLAFIGSKYVYATVCLYVLFCTEFDLVDVVVPSFTVFTSVIIFEVVELVTVVYCCKFACFQVSVI